MTISVDQREALDELDARLKTILPEEYQDSYDDVQPVSMGSAGLKYADDGRVAWDQIWGTFCDLAMAGGPPHKGMLLEPGARGDIDARPERYREVVDEVCRGVTLVTHLRASASPIPGWCRVACYSERMSGWLLRAIVMENIAARAEGVFLDLPASPAYRLDKEIKNVITVIAKTCHYWLGHIPYPQQHEIEQMFTTIAAETPLLVPATAEECRRTDDTNLRAAIAQRILRHTGLRRSAHDYAGWLGVECPSVRLAIWMMRALVVSNVLSRREGTALFVPVNQASDATGDRVSRSLSRIHGLAMARLAG